MVIALSLSLAACHSSIGEEKPEKKPRPSIDEITSAERPISPNKPKKRDTLWNWEIPGQTPAKIYTSNSIPKSWEIQAIDKKEYQRFREIDLAYNLFQTSDIPSSDPPVFHLATKDYYVAYDSEVPNPEWGGHYWYYNYWGYAKKLKLYFASRTRIVSQGLILDSLSNTQFVLNADYDSGWKGLVPAPGNSHFFLWGVDYYSGEGFTVISAEIIRKKDSVYLEKTGNFYSDKLHPLELISINRRQWAIKAIQYSRDAPDMYEKHGQETFEQDTLYFKALIP